MKKIHYPVNLAPRGKTVDTYKMKDGKKQMIVPDPYRFLEDPDSEETKKWIAAENVISEKFLSKLDMQDKILGRMKALSNYDKIGIPAKHGDHYYFKHESVSKNQPILYKIREKNSKEASVENPLRTAEVFIDPNEFKD